MIKVRPAMALHAGSMAQLLNEIVLEGGTTARTQTVKGQDLADWMAEDKGVSIWLVALDATEQVVGFQYIRPEATLPSEATNIATFVKVGQTGLGIGSALFNATAKKAKELGFVWINANIRSDNESGLVYYQSRGFRDYGVIDGFELADGTIVQKTLKRYDL